LCIKPTYQTQSVPVNLVSRVCIFKRNASPLLGRSLSTGLSNRPFFSYWNHEATRVLLVFSVFTSSIYNCDESRLQ